MGLGSIGIPSMILILVIALLIFGPKRLPEFGKAAGATLKGFKDSVNDLVSDDEEEEKGKEKVKTTEEPIKEDHKE